MTDNCKVCVHIVQFRSVYIYIFFFKELIVTLAGHTQRVKSV